MTAITRRGALLSASAAVAVAGVPTAVAAQAGDAEPLVAMERRMLARGAFLDNHPSDDHAQWEAVDREWNALQEKIAETPARTVQGLAVKLRLIAEDSLVHPMDEKFEQGLIRSAVESAERLAGEARS